MRDILRNALNNLNKKTCGTEIKIGTRVRTVNLGPPATGVIVGILNSSIFRNLIGENIFPSVDVGFSTLYPEWKNKNVLYIKFDKPRKLCTLEQWTESGRDSDQYELLPSFAVASQPEDDVEIIEGNLN